MPNTTLTVPTLIQTVNISGRSEYHVRPLFSDSPVATHRRYAEALLKYKEELRRSFKKFPVSREKMEELGWFQFAPEIKLTHLSLQFDVGNHFIKGGFSVASFEVGGNVFGCLPSVNNFMFLVPKNERGKADVSATAEAVVQRLLKKIAKDSREDFKAEHYFSPKKEVLTTVEQVVNVGQTQFDFEKDPMQFFFARFRKSVEWDGGEEIQNVASDLLEQYPAMLRRAILLEEQAERLFDLLFKNETAAAASKKSAEDEDPKTPSPKTRPEKAAPHTSHLIPHTSSPVAIIGKEGVGKHTLVEEVAWRYADNGGKGRDINKRSRLWHLNPNRVIAGMSIVGEWERRMEAILKYVRAPKGREDFPDKILIDNPVALLRIGKTSQTDLTLSRVLKPYLEKRQVQLILLATPEEWKIVQETDRGFADLFSVMRLQEPDLPTAIRIVLHNRRSLELENDCNITVPAISQLFTIHRNFLKNRALPGSVMKMLAQIAAKYRQRKVDAPEVREEFKATSGLEERIFDEETKLEKEEIRQALETELVGQPAAVAALADTVHLIKAKLTDRNRPLGSFLFIGSTGTGKTHAAKQLCKLLLGNEDSLLRFDMNEYLDPGALHRLIGDPHNPEGQLTGKVRYRPFSVILLDEIEKAHPKIHDLLLQMLDDARLTDSLGRTVDFSNSIIIMTSNLGAREAATRLGFQVGERDDSSVFRKAVENFFRPELVNRIERIVIFNPLTFNEVQKIAQLQIRELLQREGFVRRTTIVNVSSDALDWVARRGFDAKMGGRALKRQIERDLTLLSAEQLLETPPGTPVIFDILLENNQLQPRITPLEFVKPNPDDSLPELPNESNAGRFIGKLLHDLEIIDLRISNFEQRQGKTSHWRQGETANWEHFHFKNQVAEVKERLQFLKLRHRDRRHFPALPLRLKRTAIFPRQPNSYRAELATFRDRMFQQEALDEIRESYRNLSPSFDSLESELLVSFLDVALLKVSLEGFLQDKKDRLTLIFESCVSNAGKKEVAWSIQHYRQFFEKTDIPHSVNGQKIEVEGYGLLQMLEGEEGIHLFYQPHQSPLPVRLTLQAEGKPPKKHRVVRLIDNLETLTDLRTGYSNVAQFSADEFKLLLFGGMEIF